MNTNEKLREALEKCLIMFNATDKDPIHCVRVMLDAKIAVKEALALPRRNCDVGTAKEQALRFDNFCNASYNINNPNGPCYKCPLTRDGSTYEFECGFAWAQTPYEQEGEE